MTTPNNIDRSHAILRNTWFLVFHANGDLSRAFIAQPILSSEGRLDGWADNSNRPRLAFADDRILVLGEVGVDHVRHPATSAFFDAEELFHC